jgi:hypothetical protein
MKWRSSANGDDWIGIGCLPGFDGLDKCRKFRCFDIQWRFELHFLQPTQEVVEGRSVISFVRPTVPCELCQGWEDKGGIIRPLVFVNQQICNCMMLLAFR